MQPVSGTMAAIEATAAPRRPEPMTAQAQPPRTHLRIHHLGLDARDALLVESALRMRAELANRYAFGPPLPGEPVDILFVNGDNERALERWHSLRGTRGELLGVMVSRQNPQLHDMPWISRPISVRDCAAIVSILAAAQLTAQANSPASDTH